MKLILEKYKNNELSAEQQTALEEKLMTELFDARAREEWDDKLSKNGVKRTQPQMTVSKPASSNLRWWLAAASVALLVAVGSQFLFNAPPPVSGSLLTQYSAEHDQTLGQRMKIPTSSDVNWTAATDAFNREKYANAAAAIEKIGANMTDEQRFYLGLSYFYNKNFDKSIPNFEAILSKGERKSAESRWYLALSFLQNKQVAEAEQQLKKIVEENDYKAAEAANLLKEMAAKK
ncbi:MAG: hypothetical protein RL757_551 [Bacteroidota bacterium]|jgi:hypothetical protein